MTSRTKPSRPWRVGRLGALLVVGGLAVSSCTFHPGDAAVVNGQGISQSKIDNLVLAACNFSKVQREQAQGTSPSTSMAYLRHVFVQNEISFVITNTAATQLNLTVSPAAIAKVTSGESIPSTLSSEDQQVLKQFFTASARSQLQQATIGAHLRDPSVTTADNVTSADLKAATPYMNTFTAKQKVVVNPAFGSWSGSQVVDTQGSLSVPQSNAAKTWLTLRQTDSNSVAGLPPSQVCG